MMCTKCLEIKPLDRFAFRNETKGYRKQCKDCISDARKKQPKYGLWYKANKRHVAEYMKFFKIKKLYGITKEQYTAMAALQNGVCLICKIKPKCLVIDHCHKTDKIRGLLCNLCNVGLGAFKDNSKFLIEASKYLEAI